MKLKFLIKLKFVINLKFVIKLKFLNVFSNSIVSKRLTNSLKTSTRSIAQVNSAVEVNFITQLY